MVGLTSEEVNLRGKTIEGGEKVRTSAPIETAQIVTARGDWASSSKGQQDVETLAGALNAALRITQPVIDDG